MNFTSGGDLGKGFRLRILSVDSVFAQLKHGSVPHAYSYGVEDEYALDIGTNILVYAVTH